MNNPKIDRIKELVHTIDEAEKELEAITTGSMADIPAPKKRGRQKKVETERVADQILDHQINMITDEPPKKRRGRQPGWKPKPKNPYAYPKPEVKAEGAKHLNWFCEDCGHDFNTGTDIEAIACPKCESMQTSKSKYQDFDI